MKKVVSIFILVCFFVTGQIGAFPVYAQDFVLPAPGTMVQLSPAFNPPILKGIKIHPENPFRFDFILDQGDRVKSPYGGDVEGSVIASAAKQSQQEQLKIESTKLIKYFLASLTIPEKDLWVNLSPYEKNRIIPQSFGLTEMGRDLLAEDYMLKQITASLIYPEGSTGKKFWKRIYEEAGKKFGTTNIPVNTFNKVWIVPEKAVVYENTKAGTAYVVEAKLKVMLEQDYLSMSKHAAVRNDVASVGTNIVREIVLPELNREVNEDENFSQLRQVYNSLILATWYKKKIKESILELVYGNKNKVAGVNIDDPQEKEKIYQRYLQAFKKGAYNFIKEDIDPITQKTTPRKYFSGGEDVTNLWKEIDIETDNRAMLSSIGKMMGDHLKVVVAQVNPFSERPDPGLAVIKKKSKGVSTLRRRIKKTIAISSLAAILLTTASYPWMRWGYDISPKHLIMFPTLEPELVFQDSHIIEYDGHLYHVSSTLSHQKERIQKALNTDTADRRFWEEIFANYPQAEPVSAIVTLELLQNLDTKQLNSLFNGLRTKPELVYRYLSEIPYEQMQEFSSNFARLKPGIRQQVFAIFYQRLREDFERIENGETAKSILDKTAIVQAERMRRLYGEMMRALNVIHPLHNGEILEGPLVMNTVPATVAAPYEEVAFTEKQSANAIYSEISKLIEDYHRNGYAVTMPDTRQVNIGDIQGLINRDTTHGRAAAYIDNSDFFMLGSKRDAILNRLKQKGVFEGISSTEMRIRPYKDRDLVDALSGFSKDDVDKVRATIFYKFNMRRESYYVDNKAGLLLQWVQKETSPQNPYAHRITQQELIAQAFKFAEDPQSKRVDLFDVIASILHLFKSLARNPQMVLGSSLVMAGQDGTDYIWDQFQPGIMPWSSDSKGAEVPDDQGRLVFQWRIVDPDGNDSIPLGQRTGIKRPDTGHDFYHGWGVLLLDIYTSLKPLEEVKEDLNKIYPMNWNDLFVRWQAVIDMAHSDDVLLLLPLKGAHSLKISNFAFSLGRFSLHNNSEPEIVFSRVGEKIAEDIHGNKVELDRNTRPRIVTIDLLSEDRSFQGSILGGLNLEGYVDDLNKRWEGLRGIDSETAIHERARLLVTADQVLTLEKVSGKPFALLPDLRTYLFSSVLTNHVSDIELRLQLPIFTQAYYKYDTNVPNYSDINSPFIYDAIAHSEVMVPVLLQGSDPLGKHLQDITALLMRYEQQQEYVASIGDLLPETYQKFSQSRNPSVREALAGNNNLPRAVRMQLLDDNNYDVVWAAYPYGFSKTALSVRLRLCFNINSEYPHVDPKKWWATYGERYGHNFTEDYFYGFFTKWLQNNPGQEIPQGAYDTLLANDAILKRAGAFDERSLQNLRKFKATGNLGTDVRNLVGIIEKDTATSDNEETSGIHSRAMMVNRQDTIQKRIAQLEDRISASAGINGSGNPIGEINIPDGESLTSAFFNQLVEILNSGKVVKINLSGLKNRSFESPEDRYRFLEKYLKDISDFIASRTDLYKGSESGRDPSKEVSVLINDLLDNAFVHGNHLDFDLPLYIKVDNKNKTIEVFDLNLTSLGEDVDQDAMDASKDILWGAHLFKSLIGYLNVLYTLEDVRGSSEIIGKKARIDFAMKMGGAERLNERILSQINEKAVRVLEKFGDKGYLLSAQAVYNRLDSSDLKSAFASSIVRIRNPGLPVFMIEYKWEDSKEGGLVFVDPSGQIIGWMQSYDLNGYAHLADLGVLPKYQRLGIGRFLFNYFLKKARNQGVIFMAERGSFDFYKKVFGERKIKFLAEEKHDKDGLVGIEIPPGNLRNVDFDSAMEPDLGKGGIDLTPAKMKLETKIDSSPSLQSSGIQFHLDPAMLVQLQNAPGFVPVIISIQPMRDVRTFLESR